jgi:endonuclease-3
MKPAPAAVPTDATADFAARQAKALLVHARLCAEYGAPFPFFSTKDPLSELVSALLSHRTKNADSHRAYQELKATYPTWEAVRDAPPPEGVQHAIRACTWPEQKAPRIQAVLREISIRCGTDAPCSLDFLAEMPIPEARAWLESISGVGPKTSAATLLFSTLRIPAMPVDSHHHRVAQRLALIGPKVSEGPAHKLLEALLPPGWDAQQVYDHHEALMFHGQKCCYFSSPACGRCVVLDQCPFGQARLGRTE